MDAYAKITFQRELQEIQKAIRGTDFSTPKDSLVNTLQLPPDWLEQAWKNSENRQLICEHQQLPIGFIAQRWLKMTTLEQRTCCFHQKFTTEFIKGFWMHIKSHHRELCCEHQPVPVELMEECWDYLNNAQQLLCIWRQKFFNQVSPEELPKYLTSSKVYIRRAAMKSMMKHVRKGNLVGRV